MQTLSCPDDQRPWYDTKLENLFANRKWQKGSLSKREVYRIYKVCMKCLVYISRRMRLLNQSKSLSFVLAYV